jgi:NAD(P)-dependent dehydrogenase (short-subunit alcohol dehydrogenase family)
MELDLLSLDSVVKFADAWNARMAPLHVLINNAGIFAIGGLQDYLLTQSFGSWHTKYQVSIKHAF